MQIKAIRMGMSIIYFKGHRLSFPNNCISVRRIVFTIISSVDLDENATLYSILFGSSLFAKYPFRGSQFTKGHYV